MGISAVAYDPDAGAYSMLEEQAILWAKQAAIDFDLISRVREVRRKIERERHEQMARPSRRSTKVSLKTFENPLKT